MENFITKKDCFENEFKVIVKNIEKPIDTFYCLKFYFKADKQFELKNEDSYFYCMQLYRELSQKEEFNKLAWCWYVNYSNAGEKEKLHLTYIAPFFRTERLIYVNKYKSKKRGKKDKSYYISSFSKISRYFLFPEQHTQNNAIL